MSLKLNLAGALFLAGLLATPTHAADCTLDGTVTSSFCITKGASRSQMYAAREAVCNSDRWRTAGRYNVGSTTGYLTWSGADTQQTCWNAFDDIINQCKLGNNGWHYHQGDYDYNGVRYFAQDCDNS